MKIYIIKFFSLLILGSQLFISCKDGDLDETSQAEETSQNGKSCVKRKNDLLVYSPYGSSPTTVPNEFTKFSFAKGDTVSKESDEWDIAFKGTDIIVNGGTRNSDGARRTGEAGAAMILKDFDRITEAPEGQEFKKDTDASYAIDKQKSDEKWYRYTGAPNHQILPLEGRTLLFRTHDGKYAKMKIISYYKGAPADPGKMNPNSGYYTFEYVYQPDGNSKKLECKDIASHSDKDEKNTVKPRLPTDQGKPIPKDIGKIDVKKMDGSLYEGEAQNLNVNKEISFSFAKGKVVRNDDPDADISFKTLRITPKNGAALSEVVTPFGLLKEVPENIKFNEGILNAFDYWFQYNHFVTPSGCQVSGSFLTGYSVNHKECAASNSKTFILRTRDNKYAKIQFISYYEGQDDKGQTSSGHIHFRYVYQSDDSKKFE